MHLRMLRIMPMYSVTAHSPSQEFMDDCLRSLEDDDPDHFVVAGTASAGAAPGSRAVGAAEVS